MLATAVGVLRLGERQRFRLFVRRDVFERFIVCLIYVPRENYTTDLRQKWQAILLEAFNGTSTEFNTQLSEVGARTHHDHRAHDTGQDSRVRRSRVGSEARRSVSSLGRRSERRR